MGTETKCFFVRSRNAIANSVLSWTSVPSRPVYPAGRDGTGRDRDGIFKTGRDCAYAGPDSNTTYTESGYHNHEKSVHDTQFVCLRCNKGFASNSRLKRHFAQSGHSPKQLIKNTSKESNSSDLAINLLPEVRDSQLNGDKS